MSTRRYTRDCRVPGCCVTLAKYHPFGVKHEAMEHRRCNCGWVGTSFAKHVAQRRRFGSSTARCYVVAIVPAPPLDAST